MAFDGFLFLTDIEGESQDDAHANEIDILSWSWGMTQSGSMGKAGGGGVGKVNIQDLSVTKHVDKATPNLMKYCAKGDPIKEGKLIIRKAGGEALEYLVVEMADVIVTSVSTGGSDGDEDLIETISLNFAHVNAKYISQEAVGGGSGVIDFNWNVEKNADVGPS